MDFWELVAADGARVTGAAGPRDRAGVVALAVRDLGFRAVLGHRLAHGPPGTPRGGRLWGKALTRWAVATLHVEIPRGVVVGPGLRLHHPFGVVIHREAVLGAGVSLTHHVTIGQIAAGPRRGVPRVGDGVYIGPGACVLGGITVGDGALIGAGAVVIDDVPPGCTVAGNPARVVTTSEARAARAAAAAAGDAPPG